MTTAGPTTEPAAALRPGPARGLRIALVTSDPGLGRLRTVATTVAQLAVTAAVVVGVVLLVGGPVVAAVTGVVLALVTGIAGRGQPPREHVVLCLWAALSVSLAAALGTVVGSITSPAGIVAFVSVGVVVVFLQRLGARGFAAGMAGFMGFLTTSLTGLSLVDVPYAVGAAGLAVVTVSGTRWLLRTRRPERAARHALEAVEARAGFALLALGEFLRGHEHERARVHVRQRLAALRRTVTVADDQLSGAGTAVLPGLSDRALGVRVFDLRVGIEHLAGLLTADDRPDLVPAPELAARFEDVGHALLAPREDIGRWDHVGELEADGPPEQARVRRTLARVIEEWRRPPDGLDEEAPPAGTDGGSPDDADVDDDDGEDRPGGAPPTPPVSDTLRRAVQVALAIALAALAGQWISSSQWFFAVVVAFTVFLSTSSRGAVLGEGWRRTVGTLVGVVVGVGLASLFDGAVVPTVLVLAVCLVGAIYVMGLSSTALMLFITVAIALVYGLIGRFTVDVLLLRLAETAAGAAIGIAVSFLVLPTRTRTTLDDTTARFLRATRAVVEESIDVLTGQEVGRPVVQTVDEGRARELRDAHGAVVAAADPLTDGLAGALDRGTHRTAQRVVGACDHHARLLLRLARRHGSLLGDDDEAAAALQAAAEHVAVRLDALADAMDSRAEPGPTAPDDDPDEHRRVFGTLDEFARRLGRPDRDGDVVAAVDAAGAQPDTQRVAPGVVLEAVGGRLRAIDRALSEISDRRR